MKRLFDFLLAVIVSILLIVPIILVALAVGLTSKGGVLYWSDRIGKDNIIYKMPKFRSIKIDTPALATHLMTDHNAFLSPIGAFLRRSA